MKILKYLGQGLLHYEKEMPCQDYIRTYTAENGNIILAVSDGCSSAEFAVEGATINTQAVINIFKDMDISCLCAENNDLKKKLLEECLRLITEDYSLKQKAEPDKYSDRDLLFPEYSATLLFAVINTSKSKAVVGHIGDGLAVCTDKEGKICYISDADNINNQSNMTYFTTSYDAEVHLMIDCIESVNIESIFLSSDGAYQMLLEYGYNSDRTLEFFAGTIAAQITHMVSTGETKTNADLAYLLDELCYYPLLRKDDWAIVIWNKSNEPETENEKEKDEALIPVIMMDIEKKKSAKSVSKTEDETDKERGKVFTEGTNGNCVNKTDEKNVKKSNKEIVEETSKELDEQISCDMCVIQTDAVVVKENDENYAPSI